MYTKQTLRIFQKELRKTLNNEAISRRIVLRFFELPEFKKSEKIFCYIPFGDELDLSKILSLYDKKIFVPKINGENMIMTKYTPENLVKNKYGILEPKNGRVVLPQKTDIVVIPALAADRNFNRLGYGGGYYDRFLRNVECIKAILLPEALLVSDILTDENDVKCSFIVTENEIIR